MHTLPAAKMPVLAIETDPCQSFIYPDVFFFLHVTKYCEHESRVQYERDYDTVRYLKSR